MWRSVPAVAAAARARRVGRPGAAGTVFLSTEYDAEWELAGTSRRPEVAFGWATSFPADGEPVEIRHDGVAPGADPGRVADDHLARRALGDEEAGGSMRALREGPARGQTLFALASVAFLVVAMTWLDRVGPKAPAAIEAGSAPSGSWICPHGGGPDLSVALFLANPGQAAVTARVTSLGAQAPPAPSSLDVPAGSTVRVNLPPGDRGAATSVEFFGGWIGVGWVAFTDGGVAAEPCAPGASQRWLLADASTELGEVSSVIVANPFSSPAVLDVVLYTADRPPIRESEWTELVVPARRSIALQLNSRVKGEPVVAVTLEVSVGRVAAASLVESDGTTVRSAMGWTDPASTAIFPMLHGSGQTELLLLSTASGSIRFGATALSEDEPRPAGGLTEREHGPTAARAYAIPGDAGPSAVKLFTLEESARSRGRSARSARVSTSARPVERSRRPTRGSSCRPRRRSRPTPEPCS